MMDSKSVQVRLNFIDKHIDDLSLGYQGMYIWPHIRGKIALLLLQKKTKVSYAKSKFEWQMLPVFILSCINFIRIWCSKCDFNELYFNSSSGIFNDQGFFLDCYTGRHYKKHKDVLFVINMASFSNAHSFLKLFLMKNVISDNGFFKLLSLTIKPFISKRILSNNWDITTFDISKATSLLNSQFPELLSEKQILNFVAEYCSQYLTYKKMLSAFKNKKSKLISSYSKFPLVCSLNSLNCSVHEIQHGIGGEYHVGYNMFCYKESKVYKYPSLDVIQVYDEFWARTFRKCDLFRNSIVEIHGNKKLDLASCGVLPLTLKKNKYILITGQGQFYEQLAQLITDIIENSSNEFLVVYRPHPKESNEILSYLKMEQTKTFRYFDDRNTLTELLIKECHSHISVYSACHFDAIYFHGETYCFDIMDDSPIAPWLHKNKAFIKFRSASEFFNKMARNTYS